MVGPLVRRAAPLASGRSLAGFGTTTDGVTIPKRRTWALRRLCLRCLADPRRRSALLKAAVVIACGLPYLFARLGKQVGGSAPRGVGSHPPPWRKVPAEVMVTSFPEGATEALTEREGRLKPLGYDSGTSFGGLRIDPLRGERRRRIRPDPRSMEADPMVVTFLGYDDQYEPYDDDDVRTQAFRKTNSQLEHCRRFAWHKFHFPTCNKFHEVDLLWNNVQSLGQDTFRQALSIKGGSMDPNAVTLKVVKLLGDDDFNAKRHEMTRMDALVMERLTSSPRISNMHGHCATSIIVELLSGDLRDVVVPTNRIIQRSDLNDEDDVDNKNNMTSTEKLKLALAMSEALSELHGYKEGIISHDDMDLDQFLRTSTGEVKLNDFNMAKPLLWDPVNQQYCKYRRKPTGGKRRSPEEFTYSLGNLDEKIDIYSMGNNFYGILTGLWPFYLYGSAEAKIRMVRGERPHVDKRWRKRSFAEKKITEIMERMWAHDPDKRPTIFEVVAFLRDAAAENTQLESFHTKI